MGDRLAEVKDIFGQTIQRVVQPVCVQRGPETWDSYSDSLLHPQHHHPASI